MFKKHPRSLIVVAGALSVMFVVLSGCAARETRVYGERPQPIRIATIVQWSHDGVKPSEIIHRLHDSGTVYRLSARQLVHLHEEGVSNSVLEYMQDTYIDAVSRNRAYWNRRAWDLWGDGYLYGGVYYGWPWPDFDFHDYDEDEGDSR